MLANKVSFKRKVSALVAGTLLLTAIQGTATPSRAESMPVIGILQTASTSVLETSLQGITASLTAAGYTDGKTAQIIVSNAKGDAAVLATDAQQFVDQKVALIITIGTPAAQAANKATASSKSPLVIYSTVTDPFSAGLAAAACNHPAWIAGYQGLAPFAQVVTYITQVKPTAKTIGYVYNPAESNSVAATKVIQPAADKLGLKLDIKTVGATTDVAAAVQALVADKVDAFMIGSDNTVVAGIDAYVKAATDAKIPVFSVNPGDAKTGAVVALGLDYVQAGADAGHLAGLVLNKKIDLSKAKIVNESQTILAVNSDAAAATGVTIPADVLSSAGITYKGGQASMSATATMAATMAASSDDDFIKARTCTADEITAAAAATPNS